MQASDITAAISTLTGAFDSITGWFPIIIAIGFFVAGTAINLIAGFFGKKKRKEKDNVSRETLKRRCIF